MLSRAVGDIATKTRKRVEKGLEKARTRDSIQALDKLTHLVDGGPRIAANPPLIVPMRDLLPGERADEFHEWARAGLREYRAPWRSTAAACSSATSSPTWRARWWASEASGPGPGSS